MQTLLAPAATENFGQYQHFHGHLRDQPRVHSLGLKLRNRPYQVVRAFVGVPDFLKDSVGYTASLGILPIKLVTKHNALIPIPFRLLPEGSYGGSSEPASDVRPNEAPV